MAKDLLERFGEDWYVSAMKVLSADVKSILFLTALSAVRSKTELGELYRRLVKDGKKKMVALVAVMRKIVVIANARMRDYFPKRNNHNIVDDDGGDIRLYFYKYLFDIQHG